MESIAFRNNILEHERRQFNDEETDVWACVLNLEGLSVILAVWPDSDDDPDEEDADHFQACVTLWDDGGGNILGDRELVLSFSFGPTKHVALEKAVASFEENLKTLGRILEKMK